MSRRQYASLQCILLFCLAWPCLAAEPQQGKRVMCGEYSYILPEGFSAFDMPQQSEGKIYLNQREYDAHSKAENVVLCIQTENTDNKNFILDSVRIIKSIPKAKHDLYFSLKQYEKIFKDYIRVYYNAYYVYKGIINWASIFVEMDAHDSAKHTILYFNSSRLRRDVKKERRIVTVEMCGEDLKKIALEFINSIQKVR